MKCENCGSVRIREKYEGVVYLNRKTQKITNYDTHAFLEFECEKCGETHEVTENE